MNECLTRPVQDKGGIARKGGEGPGFPRFGARVRYLPADIEAWALARLRGCCRHTSLCRPRPRFPEVDNSAQFIDIKWINPYGRGLDEVWRERRIEGR